MKRILLITLGVIFSLNSQLIAQTVSGTVTDANTEEIRYIKSNHITFLAIFIKVKRRN